jgi:hypothetical protein
MQHFYITAPALRVHPCELGQVSFSFKTLPLYRYKINTMHVDQVEASVKRQARIKDAGHFAAFSQPGQFLEELLRDVRLLAIAPAPTQVMGCQPEKVAELA